MLKNVVVKNIIKKTIFPFFTLINKFVPKSQSVVLLYTANKGVCHSLIPLRKYLLDNGFDKKYIIYCGIENMRYADGEMRVKYVAGVKAVMVFLKAGHVFYTAGQIPIKPSNKQLVFHLRHGNANFKSSGSHTNIHNGDEFYFTHMIAPSELFVPIMASEYLCSEKNILVAGDPMTDQLIQYPKDSYDLENYDKVLFWLPTFRQSDYYGYNDTQMSGVVPLFDSDEYEVLNEKLSAYNVKLIVKAHYAQTVDKDTDRHFSHLSVYSNDEFIRDGYEIYRLMAQCDGLIGDYSSASLQYLLTDRPQAYVVPDIDEYRENRSFVFEPVEDYMGGHIIKNKEQFYQFIEDFASGKDVYRDKRHWVCDQIYKYHDANSCQRIVNLNGMSLDESFD